MKSFFLPACFLSASLASTAFGQGGLGGPQPAAPEQQSQPAQQQPTNTTIVEKPAPSSQPKQQGSFLGGDAPVFDPSTEIFTWDGKSWHVTDNRIFQARFEKYLAAPEETSAQDVAYQQILTRILWDLAPGNSSPDHINEAFRLLARASTYDIDARLCESIADAVYSAWRAQNNQAELTQADSSLEDDRKRQEWNAKLAASSLQMDQAPGSKDKANANAWQKDEDQKRDMDMQQYTVRLAEIMATIKANQAKKELSELQSKIDFQALLVQLFLQRRFQHVLIGTRFYRAVFTDGDTSLKVGKEARDMFAGSTGLPPTVGTMDSMADEVIRDVREGVQAYTYLLSQNELESASKRLAESFTTGEYLPEIRTLPRDQKRKALQFEKQSDQLLSALEVKDYTLADKLVASLATTATDFDTSKATAAIETAKQISAFHLAKARNAAVSGDKTTLETELTAATEIWPRNPDLKKAADLIFNQGDVQEKALVDLDQLLSQKNYRAIYDDKMRFIAAVAMYPDRQEQLKKVIDQMATIDTAMIQANEMSRQSDFAGAWEVTERTFQKYPDDSKLNELRANLTTQAAEFVLTLRKAQDLEQKDEVGSSLALYLKAQKLYPASDYAQDGIQRLSKLVLPASS